MIYTDLELANERILELEAKVSLLESIKKTDRVIVSNFIEGNISLCDVPVPFKDFLNEDGSYDTINQHCSKHGRDYEKSSDGTRFIFPYEVSDLFNVYGGLKEILITQLSQQLGGEDFTKTGDNLFWIMTYSEKNKFKLLNPKWKSEENF